MNFNRLVSFLITLFIFTSVSVSQWSLQNPTLQAERLTDIVIADSTTAYCTCYFGRIMESTDKGNTWQVLETGCSEIFIKSFFLDSKTGWALTYDSNRLYKTTNSGFSWNQISQIDSNRIINDFFFISENTGFITGDFNSMIRSDDGGITWNTINITNTPWSGTSSVFFVDKRNGFVTVNSSLLYKTNDSGVKWKQINTKSYFSEIKKIYAIDTLKLFVAGGHNYEEHQLGFLSISSDGGKLWNQIYFDKPIQDIFFKNLKSGALIKDSKIFVTEDGGINWKETQISASNFLFFNDGTTSLAINGSNLIKMSTNFWRSHTNATPSITSNCLYSVSPIDSSNVAACGSNETIVITNNGGRIWQQVHKSGKEVLNDILYIDQNHIIAAGSGGIILRSTDCGKSWIRDSLDATWISDLELVNDSLLFAAASNNGNAILFISSDIGKTWRITPDLDIASSIDRIKFANEKLGWITAGNILYKTTDKGLNWNMVKGVDILYGNLETLGNTLWLTKGNSILITNDAGETWNQYKMFDYKQNSFATYCISMKNSVEGLIGLYDGRIYNTYDGGKSWVESNQITSTPIFDLKYIDNKYAWAVGDCGLILKYNDIKTSIGNNLVYNISTRFILWQNYPNPFNPTTTIKYSIPNVGTRHGVYVQLKVYNILGREVATLVNEEKLPGIYEVTFDASHSEQSRGMASGVYFYRLQANSFSETKKFVLMK